MKIKWSGWRSEPTVKFNSFFLTKCYFFPHTCRTWSHSTRLQTTGSHTNLLSHIRRTNTDATEANGTGANAEPCQCVSPAGPFFCFILFFNFFLIFGKSKSTEISVFLQWCVFCNALQWRVSTAVSGYSVINYTSISQINNNDLFIYFQNGCLNLGKVHISIS